MNLKTPKPPNSNENNGEPQPKNGMIEAFGWGFLDLFSPVRRLFGPKRRSETQYFDFDPEKPFNKKKKKKIHIFSKSQWSTKTLDMSIRGQMG